ncbi:ATP-grasp domain-containing protein [Caloramator sp. mosi_1]|nr:ATP-grasp domain-containing protein [Caloramator sp. mosi_1]WDC84511.1 ATP-grasp domain-containing protein [Caloramator sp. mosi_1]
MLKFSKGGYDGKGNILINSSSHLREVVSNLEDEFL